MRNAMALVLLALAMPGCLLPDGDGGDGNRVELPVASGVDLARPGGIQFERGEGWSGVRVRLDAAFWDAAADLHEPRVLPFHVVGQGWYLSGVRDVATGDVALFGAAAGNGYYLTWDEGVGERPELDVFFVGGGAAEPLRVSVGEPWAAEPLRVRADLAGRSGDGGSVVRIPLTHDTVGVLELGALRFNETYVFGTGTPVGTAVPARVTHVFADGGLEGPGLAACFASAYDIAGAAAWDFRFAAGERSWTGRGAGAWPAGDAADAAPIHFSAPIPAGKVRLDLNRTFSGFVTAFNGGAVFSAACAWADLDPAALGWTVTARTPQDDVTERLLEPLPMEPPATLGSADAPRVTL